MRSRDARRFEANLLPLTKLQPRLIAALAHQGNHQAARSLASCSEQRRCRNAYCAICTSIRAVAERASICRQLTNIYSAPRRPVVWAASPTALDSARNHRARSLEVVKGIRQMVRTLPITNWFGATEATPSTQGDTAIHSHAHVILHLDTPPDGSGFVKAEEWSERIDQAWQKAAPAIAINCAPRRLSTLPSALGWARYSTKLATFTEAASFLEEDLGDPESFLAMQQATRGVPKYFGSMSRSALAASWRP